MAIIALVEGALLALVIVAYIRTRRSVAEEVGIAAREAREFFQTLLSDQRVLTADAIRHSAEQREFLREELHQALDRVQSPELAVQASISDQAAKAPAVRRLEEPSLGDVERRQRIEAAERDLQRVEAELARRGITPSELSSATAGSNEGV